ncbi:amidohydrolase family protein [Roseinatronobacter sp.]
MSGIDAHCHIWALDRGDYGWIDRTNPALAAIAQDFGTSDLSTRLAQAAITRAIVVQAAPTEDETRWLLEQARHRDAVAGIVGWADLTQPDIGARLRAMAADGALRGIRPMLQDIAQDDWLLTAPQDGWVPAMLQHDLRFDALVLPRHLDMLLRFCNRHPDLPVVIDHAAKPALAAAPDDPRHELWRSGMQRLARDTAACCKISGLLTEMDPAQLPHARDILFPVMDDLLDWFGADRLMWGSDWPVLRLAGSYDGWHALFHDWLAHLPALDRAKISGQTAARFYGLDGAGHEASPGNA